MSDRAGALAQQLAQRGITRLVHFTRLENLPSILRHGLLPRQDLDRRRLPYHYNDAVRLDGRLDTLCTTVSFPNYRMFYTLRQKQHAHWIVLQLDARLLLDKPALFLPGNAACWHYQAALQAGDCSEPAHFAQLFADQGRPALRSTLPDCYPTDPQAEVLIESAIEPEYILELHVNDPASHRLLQGMLAAAGKNIATRTCRESFAPRHDYANWKGH